MIFMRRRQTSRPLFIAALLLAAAAILLSTTGSARAQDGAQNKAPASAPQADATSPWIQPQAPGDPLIWGRKDGILFGLPSPGGMRGPRGLIRVGVISHTTGPPEPLNCIPREPVILGPGSRSSRMAFSELEPSRLDPGEHGKRLSVDLS